MSLAKKFREKVLRKCACVKRKNCVIIQLNPVNESCKVAVIDEGSGRMNNGEYQIITDENERWVLLIDFIHLKTQCFVPESVLILEYWRRRELEDGTVYWRHKYREASFLY